MNIKIKNLLCYRNAEKYIQTFRGSYLILVVSGVEYMHITIPGHEMFDVANGTLLLLPENSMADFCFNDKRCNYSSSCEIDLSATAEYGITELPLVCKIPEKRLDLIQEIFKDAEKLANSPISRNRTAAELLLEAVLAEFIRQPENDDLHAHQAVMKLKKAIDEDVAFEHDISELMAGINCSAGHLRRLFKEHYQMSIIEYRSRMRLAVIREAMLDRRLSIKEIADVCGMKNVTHLHKFIQKYCNMTPKEFRNNLGR